MRLPAPSYPLLACVETHLPHLRPAQQRSLALWVTGTLLAGRCSQSAVLTALEPLLPGTDRNTLRQHLRDGLRDGAEKAAPCQISLDVTTCFAPLLRWVLSAWHGDQLALALDATTLADRVVVLCLSVLYRGSALPMAWRVLPANQPGPWLPHVAALITDVAGVIPPTMTVLVLTDRGLWSPRLWQQIRALGWHAVMRIRPDATFAPLGQPRRPAKTLVPGPGCAWVGTGTAFKHTHVRQMGTLVVVWETEQAEPWLLLSDLAPDEIGLAWYGLRVWIEQGFRALKSAGWQWDRIRRTDPDRVARHWLVLAVASVLTAAYGSRVEDADWAGCPPSHFHIPHTWPPERVVSRMVNLLTTGRDWLRVGLLRGRWWRSLWLLPAALPTPRRISSSTAITLRRTSHDPYLPLSAAHRARGRE